jgi:general secretion pathway protein F
VATSMSLDDLVVLNDEIASLVRAGIPLELGLSNWSRDLAGPLRKTVATLGESVARGRDLDDALADDSLEIPPVYRAVVTAGLRSGRLPAALESLADCARRVQQLQNAVVLAMIYPLLLITLAYSLLLLLLWVVLPAVASVYETRPPVYLVAIDRVGDFAARGISIPGTDRVVPVSVLPPLALWLGVVLWWLRSRQSLVIASDSLWKFIPFAGRAMRRARAASLAEIFGLLIEHEVPLPGAVRLASTCTGERRLARATDELAGRLEAGEPPTPEQLQSVGLPPVLALLIANGARQQTLVAMVRGAAENDRRRVERDITWLRDWLPVWLIITLGAAIGVVYCLTFLIPFSQMIQALGEPTSSTLRIHP